MVSLKPLSNRSLLERKAWFYCDAYKSSDAREDKVLPEPHADLLRTVLRKNHPRVRWSSDVQFVLCKYCHRNQPYSISFRCIDGPYLATLKFSDLINETDIATISSSEYPLFRTAIIEALNTTDTAALDKHFGYVLPPGNDNK